MGLALGGRLSRQSPITIELSADRGRQILVRKGTAQTRMVLRARIVLAAADAEVAREHPLLVSKSQGARIDEYNLPSIVFALSIVLVRQGVMIPI